MDLSVQMSLVSILSQKLCPDTWRRLGLLRAQFDIKKYDGRDGDDDKGNGEHGVGGCDHSGGNGEYDGTE